jgi:poly(A) polymerase
MTDGVPAESLPREAVRLFEVFEDAGEELYLVGGWVRDRMRGVEAVDLDMATGARPERTGEILEAAGIRAVPLGVEFGTVGAVLGEGRGMVEITTFRSEEVYPPGDRHPEVRFGSSIEEDLPRRDFTVNAMAMDRSGRLIDPAGGLRDLHLRLLRTPGDPVTTMMDDPLRMLRALRFSAQLGFRLAGDLRQAVEDGASAISEVAAERCCREMDRLMEVPDGERVAAALSSMADMGLLGALLPELRPLLASKGVDQGRHHDLDAWRHTLAVLAGTGPDVCLRWAALLHDAGKPQVRTVEDAEVRYIGHEKAGEEIALKVAERLRFSRRRRRCVSLLVKDHLRPLSYSGRWTDSAVRRLARDAGEHLDRLLELAGADAEAHTPEDAEAALAGLQRLVERLDRAAPRTGGRRLVPREVGRALHRMLPGGKRKIISDLLHLLEAEVAAGNLPDDPSAGECLDRLRELGELPPSDDGEDHQSGGR